MDALASALPDRSEQDVNSAYQFMLGAIVFVMADTARIARLSNGFVSQPTKFRPSPLLSRS